MKTLLPRPIVYTVTEFACLFAVSPRLVRSLIRKGELPAFRIGRSFRIPRKAVTAYLARATSSLSRSAIKPRVRAQDHSMGYLFPPESFL